MKKIVLGAAFVAAACLGTFTANQNSNEAQMSDLQLENVEALADREAVYTDCSTVCGRLYGYYCLIQIGRYSQYLPFECNDFYPYTKY